MKKLLAFTFILFTFTSFSQPLAVDLDAMMKARYKTGEPGAVLLVAKAGKPIYRQAFGMADMENNIAMRPEHLFEIGSITKQFTAVSILMLMEQGKLKLDDPVTKFIPEYPMHGYTITIHHLLTHTSGIKSYTSMEKWTKVWRQDMKPMEMIDLFKNEPMEFAPGEKWNYNNSAYFMLGYIIEKASGIPYPEFLEKNIFTPLGLKNTYYGSQSKIIRNRARGYQKEAEYANAEYLSLTQPYSAGSIISNVDDLLTWQVAINANKLVKKETIQLAHTPVKLNNGTVQEYGYGWGIGDINGSPTVEHSGGIFGYATNAIYLPKEDTYVAILTNCDCSNPGELSTRIAAKAIGKPFPDAVAKVKLDAAYAKSLTGVYEFEDGATRYITYDGEQLYSQRTGSEKFKIFPQDKTNFVYESGFSTLHLTVDKGVVKEAIMKNRAAVTKGVKTDKPIPTRLEVRLSPDVLQQYVGTYEIQPGFNLVMTVEDGHFMSQATGQAKFELFAESETKFFLKVVDAQVEFIRNAAGTFDMVLYQAGQKVPGRRVK